MAEQISFTLPNPYQAEQADIARRQKMAEIMQQQAFQPAETFSYGGIQARTSPLTGLAKMLQGYVAGKTQRDLVEEQKALGERAQRESASDIASLFAHMKGQEALPERPPVTAVDDQGNFMPNQPAVAARAPGIIDPSILTSLRDPQARQIAMSQLLSQMTPKAPIAVKEGETLIEPRTLKPIFTMPKPDKIRETKILDENGVPTLFGITESGERRNLGPAQQVISPDTAARLAQEKSLADRAFNNLSAAQQLQARQEAQRFGLSLEEYKLRQWQAQNPTPQVVQSEAGYATVQPRTGVSAPVMTPQGTQLPGAPRQAPEAYTKKADALLNMTDALNQYQNELKGFTVTTALSPDQRARIGNAYQNALLQAKEIYNLGVLNGPDKAILEQIITNPLAITSAPISNEAMVKQVEAMRKIIDRQNTNLAQVYKQPKIELPSLQPAASGTWAVVR